MTKTIHNESNIGFINERKYKAGYVIRTEVVDGNGYGGENFEIKSAYAPEGGYIGNSKRAYRLCNKFGIKPELASPDHTVCSIGFCEKENKWYGWSHRAIYGFGIGSAVKKGDCAYIPANKQDFIDDCIQFWDDKHHDYTTGAESVEEGVRGVQTNWLYNDEVKNEKLRGTISGIFTPYPDKFGKGEWIAETLDEARLMASDFAESVS